jgi:hypothetical protein
MVHAVSVPGGNPGIFWYWNCDPSEAVITRQLTEIRDAGFRSVSLHPMPDLFRKRDFFAGMRIPYLGKRYFRLFRFAVSECRRLGLIMILYDEGGWPSGTACGGVVRGNPGFAAQVLVRDETGGIVPCRFSSSGWQTDLMNPLATRKFLSLVHERYWEAAGEEFGRTIRGIFTDEPRISGAVGTDRVPWSPVLPEFFRRRNGFSVETIYPLLFPGAGDSGEVREARRLYQECCTALTVQNFYGEIAAWCHAHRIALEGHFSGEDSISCHAACFGDYLCAAAELDVPGIDAIWRQIAPGSGEGAFAKLAQSAAIRERRCETLSESFNVYGPGADAPLLNWIANTQFVHGISRIMAMPFLASSDGVRKISCGTDFSPRNPLWRLFPALAAHWEWAGEYDPGALEAPVRVRYAPLPAAWNAGEKTDDSWNAFLRALDDRWLFWRFAGNEEPEPEDGIVLDPDDPSACSDERLTRYVVLQPLNPQGHFRLQPCRRRDGREAVMVFCPELSGGVFRFASETDWTELLPPDPEPAHIEPLHRITGGFEARFASGELRIFCRGKFREPVAPLRKTCRLQWRVDSVERFRIGRRITCRRNTVGIPMPGSGDYMECDPEFSGVLHLSAELDCGEGPLPSRLCFRELWSGGILSVNGRRSGMRAFAPWVFRLDGIQHGTNRLELEVVGTLRNEWMRAWRTGWKVLGLSNAYCERIAAFDSDESRCGVLPEAELFF